MTSTRRTDPETSHEAAERHKSSGRLKANCRVMLDKVLECPGRTSAEYGTLTKLGRHEAARRLPELERSMLIQRGESRKCTLGRGNALTWWPADEPEETQAEMF